MTQVKPKVNLGSLVGGGFKYSKYYRWGPLRWSQNTTKGDGVGWVAVHRADGCPASVFGAKWGPQKGSKNFGNFRFLKTRW